ncbi:DUF1493 family protein [Marinobacterium iners]|jgi:acyl carrier protein|uniref:Acyl carrier protein n=1 Tax=Marinobacterium iners DSM 11526 TaxID=1122198 RepID=A0A1H4H4B5_9GAMM|nr:DUF1493 family protein [Marinobacterium iners]SEB16471.1 Protein of unknown function [Marinobacterium iners DSM 11526]
MNVSSNKESMGKRIILFLSKSLSVKEEDINLGSRIFHDLGVDGDDAKELMDNYANEFNVSLDGFNFNQCFGPENSISMIELFLSFFKRIDQENIKELRVEDLIDAAESGSFCK